MRKFDFLKDVAGENINDFSLEKVTLDVIDGNSPIMENEKCKVLNIEKSGFYQFENASSSKFVKINIAPELDVVIFDETKAVDEKTVIDLEINVKDNAQLFYLAVDELQTANIIRKVNIFENAECHFSNIGLNQGDNANKVIIDLLKPKARGYYKNISIARSQTNSLYDVEVNNKEAHTTGDIWQKAVVMNEGKNEYTAVGYIAPHCDDAINFQESRVLLLDKAAKGDASPLLLINHYNVQAGHAASVSRVNENELYYLQSRGIDQKTAEYMMTIAFIKPLIDEIKDEEMADKLLQKIEGILYGNA